MLDHPLGERCDPGSDLDARPPAEVGLRLARVAVEDLLITRTGLGPSRRRDGTLSAAASKGANSCQIEIVRPAPPPML